MQPLLGWIEKNNTVAQKVIENGVSNLVFKVQNTRLKLLIIHEERSLSMAKYHKLRYSQLVNQCGLKLSINYVLL